jgi:hypothetical protein
MLGLEVKRGVASREEVEAVARKEAAMRQPVPVIGAEAIVDGAVEGVDVTAIQDALDLLDADERPKFDKWIEDKGGLQKLTVKQKDSLYRRLAAA